MRIVFLLILSACALLLAQSTRTVVLTHSGPPLATNAQSTAIDGGTKNAELQNSPGYYLLDAVAVPKSGAAAPIPSGSVH